MRILFVDDSAEDRYLVARELGREPGAFELVDVADEQGFTDQLAGEAPDAVVTERTLSWGKSGLDVLRAARERWPGVPVIMYTASGSEEIAVEGLKAGLDDYIVKSSQRLPRLVAAIRAAGELADARRASAQAEMSYREFFEAMPVGLYLTFPDGVMLGANEAMVALLGYPNRESLLGTNVTDHYADGEDRERWMELLMAEGIVRGFETRLKRYDGSEIWVRETSRAVWGEGGETVVFQGSLEDITRERELESTLVQSQDRFRALAESGLIGVFVALPTGFTYVSRTLAAMVGRSPEEIIGRLTLADLADLRDRGGVEDGLGGCFSGEAGSMRFTARLVGGGGETVRCEVMGRSTELRGETAVIGLVLDLTERDRAEQDRRESETRYRTLFECAGDAIFVVDGEHFLDCNPKTLEMFACEAEEILGHHPAEFSPPTQPDGQRSMDAAQMRMTAALRGEPQHFEWKHRRANGELFDAEVSLKRLEDVGSGTFLQAIVRDVTERKVTDEALRRRTEELEVLNRLNQLLASTLDARTVMQEIVDIVRERCGVDHVSVSLLDEDSTMLSFLAWSSDYEASIRQEGLALDGPGIVAQALRTGAPVYLPDVTVSPEYLSGDDRVRSEYAVPLMSGGRAIGVLNCESFEVDGVGEWERAVIDGLSAQAAITLLNADIYRRMKASEAQYRDFIEHSEDVYFVHDMEGRLLEANPAGKLVLGFEVNDAIMRPLTDFLSPEFREQFPSYLEELRERGRSSGLMRAVTRDGEVRMLEYRNRVSFDEDGSAVVRGLARDVTDRWRAERDRKRYAARLDALRGIDRAVLAGESLQQICRTCLDRLRQLVPCDRASVALLDLEAGTAELIGVGRDQEIGAPEGTVRPIEDVYDLSRETGSVMVIDELAELESPTRGATELLEQGVRSAVVVRLEAGGRLYGALNLFSLQRSGFSPEHADVARQVAEELSMAIHEARLRETLERERALHKALVEELPEGLLLVDASHQVLLANRAAREALKSFGESVDGERLDRLGRVSFHELVEACDEERQLELSAEDGRIFEARLEKVGQGQSAQHIVVLRDVTTERETKRQLELQERLAAVGQLAAGIAHDFNNLLQAVTLNSELALGVLGKDDPATPRLAAIQEQASRGATLIRQVLDFARKTVTQPKPMELLPFIHESVRLLERSIPESVRLTFEAAPGTYMVVADPAQVQQLLTNLVVNAADAMPSGGEIRISLAERAVEAGSEPPHPDMAPGQWVRLRVEDTGCGMSREVQEKIFEPFFTTKRPGEGTGLGLAQVYGIVKQHRGYVDVRSEEGAGATFDVWLPFVEEKPVPQEPPRPAAALPSGNQELILVVEDDPAILELARQGLEALGYRVEATTDASRALELHDLHRGEVALVLTDMVMPGMGGLELAKRIREGGSDVKIMMMTGYPLEQESAADLPSEVVTWLQKPFTLGTLAATVWGILNPDG